MNKKELLGIIENMKSTKAYVVFHTDYELYLSKDASFFPQKEEDWTKYGGKFGHNNKLFSSLEDLKRFCSLNNGSFPEWLEIVQVVVAVSIHAA